MSTPNDELIKKSNEAFRIQIKDLSKESLLEIVKNYKLLLNQLDDYNGGLLKNLIEIAEFSGGKLGKLESAKMGIFQITGQNSKENYSWGGTFNTSSRNKTASITMKLTYKVD